MKASIHKPDRTLGKTAFTMLELTFVIVVLGILAALALPRFERDLKQEAADNILSGIRYTQHLALQDYKQKFDNPKWQQRFWKIMFAPCSTNTYFYRIGSDDNMSDTGLFTKNEAALDPLTGKPMYWTNNVDCSNGGDDTVSKNIFISNKYGITNIDSSNCNNVMHIGFDHLGRPHQSFGASTSADYSTYLNSSCTFKFTMSNGEEFNITIEPETGYATIGGQISS